MSWLQLILECDSQHTEQLEECLSERGALAVTFQDAEDNPLFEPKINTTPLWPTTIISALFEAETDIAELKQALSTDFQSILGVDASLKLSNKMRVEILEDENWVQKSLDQFKPKKFGDHLWVVPSWCKLAEDSNNYDKNQNKDIHVFLDPGLAFGTGTHATTTLCLEWLDKHPPKNKVVIDYGSGSGILAISSVKLGANLVFAVDHDNQALQSTLNNSRINHIEDKQFIITSDQQFNEIFSKTLNGGKADLLIANILLAPILELLPFFAALLKPKGEIILSGLLEKQFSIVKQALGDNFHSIEMKSMDDWVRVSARRNE